MILYKFIIIKIFNSILMSTVILSSVLYIFSIIELMTESYELINTLVLGLINTLELLITIPTIVFVMSLILFWNSSKKTNELLLIRHYLSLKKIMLIFSAFIVFFAYLEINKSTLSNKVKNLKEDYLKKSINNKNMQKIFFQINKNQLIITKLDGLNMSENKVEEISIYKFENDEFLNSLYSSDNHIKENEIIMKDPITITQYSISNLVVRNKLLLSQFGEYFYNNDEKITINNKDTNMKRLNFLKITLLIIILFTYTSVFLSKKGIQKNASALKYTSVSIILFTYAFVTSQTYIENYNNLLQISVLLTFTIYLYKNLANE
jgi:hypothetical protein